jgi:DNA invertase Pin-like site-specific DNA recombinase
MTAAVYARYSSENQRPESIDDQVSACRRLAKERGFTISDDHVYADQAQSGARSDRPGLAALLAAAPAQEFDLVLVDDLSRLARDNHLMLSIIAELHFEGIRVVCVADGLDSDDEEATLAIQVRGIFNELRLRDLKKKTLRGQMCQKERGFFVGEKTFGYRSVPVGEMRIDKKGRPRPDGLQDGDRAEGGSDRPAHLHVVRRWSPPHADRQDAERKQRARRHPVSEGLVTSHSQPHP